MRAFYIVGPTATGKSDLAAEAATRANGEVVSADAFQIYDRFDVLSGKPGRATLSRVPHHLIGAVPPTEEMSAARFRELVLPVIREVNARGKLPIVVGGTGLYIKALTDGLAEMPAADPKLRKELEELSLEQLQSRLTELDPEAARRVDLKNRRRVIRAMEIALAGGRPDSEQRTQWGKDDALTRSGDSPIAELTDSRRLENRRSLDSGVVHVAERETLGSSASGRCHGGGVFVFRDREDLYSRINQRVEAMLRNGAIDEVRDAGEVSRTAEQMIGVGHIRKHLAGEISLAECVSRIQQATRRYAKRQLTWFRNQSNFESLNLSLLKDNEAVERICAAALAARGSE